MGAEKGRHGGEGGSGRPVHRRLLSRLPESLATVRYHCKDIRPVPQVGWPGQGWWWWWWCSGLDGKGLWEGTQKEPEGPDSREGAAGVRWEGPLGFAGDKGAG